MKTLTECKKELGIPEWVDTENYTTLSEVFNHDKVEAWVECHCHPVTLEECYIAFDPAQSRDVRDDVACVSTDFYECSNALGERVGFTEFWVKF